MLCKNKWGVVIPDVSCIDVSFGLDQELRDLKAIILSTVV